MITNQQWLDKCEATKQMAINELQDVLRLRESLFVARGRARNALKAQTDVTNYMLRRRIYETQRARNELDWQKMKVCLKRQRQSFLNRFQGSYPGCFFSTGVDIN